MQEMAFETLEFQNIPGSMASNPLAEITRAFSARNPNPPVVY